MNKVVIASDHAGFELKQEIVGYLKNKGVEVVDLGTDSTEGADYPKYGEKLAVAIADRVAEKGILICGSGIGISIAANRHRHIRCALVTSPNQAVLSRQHNDANVIAVGSRIISAQIACDSVEAFLSTDFEGGRHQSRVDMLS